MRVDGELRADGPNGSVIVDGKGREVAVTVVGGPPRPSRRQLARLARFARDRDLLITVKDQQGRRVVDLGGSTSSMIGRLLMGSSAVRPHLRALTTLRRLGRRDA